MLEKSDRRPESSNSNPLGNNHIVSTGSVSCDVMTSHTHPPMRWPHAAATTTHKASVSSLEAVADQHPAVSTSDLQSSPTAALTNGVSA
ncbi:hypothetical protein EYF80_026964 [Liparis tanakae]|uniref:Uncharacterized protein n=1 Tax=Liparis tanakae TaxID=230148 RepID=A0A4Z2HAP8_9TELE|nr:hypothetical protein EYF80_026964 [Liparis tanakae]